MSVLLIKNGVVIHSTAGHEIDLLQDYIRRGRRPTDCVVMAYPNGFVSMHVTYSDGAHGLFDTSSPLFLSRWMATRVGWPEPRNTSITVPYPTFKEPLSSKAAVATPNVMRRRRTEVVEEPVVEVATEVEEQQSFAVEVVIRRRRSPEIALPVNPVVKRRSR